MLFAEGREAEDIDSSVGYVHVIGKVKSLIGGRLNIWKLMLPTFHKRTTKRNYKKEKFKEGAEGQRSHFSKKIPLTKRLKDTQIIKGRKEGESWAFWVDYSIQRINLYFSQRMRF